MTGEATLSITVNGQARDWTGGAVSDLLAENDAGTSGSGFAVALNGAVLPRAKWADTALKDGDRVEIVGMYKGG